MHRTLLALGMAVLLVAGAASACRLATGSNSASSTGTPWVPPTGSATLTVTGSGALVCRDPHVCVAFFLIRPADWDGSWQPHGNDPAFSMEYSYTHGPNAFTTISLVSGAASPAPTSIGPGRYRLAGAGAQVSDVGGSLAGEPYFSAYVMCAADLTVEPSTRRVDVTVGFYNEGCAIAISLDPPLSTATPRPLES